MAGPTTSWIQPLVDCPACGNSINARYTAELEMRPLTEAAAGQVEASGHLTGVQVQHDCVPKVTRDAGHGGARGDLDAQG